jgi:hypothetical protein
MGMATEVCGPVSLPRASTASQSIRASRAAFMCMFVCRDVWNCTPMQAQEEKHEKLSPKVEEQNLRELETNGRSDVSEP